MRSPCQKETSAVSFFWPYLLRGGDDMDELFNMVGNLGFPIAVTLYLLIRIESKLELLTQSINHLSKILAGDRAA